MINFLRTRQGVDSLDPNPDLEQFLLAGETGLAGGAGFIQEDPYGGWILAVGQSRAVKKLSQHIRFEVESVALAFLFANSGQGKSGRKGTSGDADAGRRLGEV